MSIKLNPTKQYQLYRHNDCRFVLDVEIIANGKLIGNISGSYQDVLNFSKIREQCGYDKVPDISKSEFKSIKMEFDKALRTVNTQTVYSRQGWYNRGEYYILGNYKIDKTNLTKIENKSRHSDIDLGAMPNNEALARHMGNYFRLLRHDVNAKILLCVSLLAMFTTRLQKTAYQPQFATFIKARYNTGKSSSAKVLTNPWGGASYSFEDTEAVLRQALKTHNDVLLLIDDMSKSKRPGMVNKNEKIIRMAGDTTTSSMKMMGGKIDDSIVGCMTLMTGEDIPQLQNSSYTRMLILEFCDNEVDWDILTELQGNASMTTWFFIRFIQYSLNMERFIQKLTDVFVQHRHGYMQKFKTYGISNRFVDMAAWIIAMWNMVKEFFVAIGEPIREDDFVVKCEDLILKLGMRYSHKSPSQLFLAALFNLIENNRLNIVSFAEAKDGTAFDIFEKDGVYFIKSGAVYDKVKAHYDSLNLDFYESERAVRKDLDACGLLQKHGKYLTSEFKDKNNRSISGFYLFVNNAREYMSKKGRNL